jgi:hypothetical protein
VCVLPPGGDASVSFRPQKIKISVSLYLPLKTLNTKKDPASPVKAADVGCFPQVNVAPHHQTTTTTTKEEEEDGAKRIEKKWPNRDTMKINLYKTIQIFFFFF